MELTECEGVCGSVRESEGVRWGLMECEGVCGDVGECDGVGV